MRIILYIAKIYRWYISKILYIKKKARVASTDIPTSVLKNNIGTNCVIGYGVKIFKPSVYIGDYTYINSGQIFYARIGKFCSIGHDVCFGGGSITLTLSQHFR